MATSSKVQFNLDTLRAKALESIDTRIAMAEEAVRSFTDHEVLAEAQKEWRTEQERRISDLFSRLGGGDISDAELATWRIDPIPFLDPFDLKKARRDLERLVSIRSKIVAKSESLVADEDGNISLTKIQLEEFFGL